MIRQDEAAARLPPADASPPPHPDAATCRIPPLRPHLSPYRRRPPSSRGIASIGNSSRVKRDGHSAQEEERRASGWIGLGLRNYDTPVPLRPTPGRPAIRAYAGTLTLLASMRTTPDLFTTTTSTPKGPRREDQEVRRTGDA
ncbi:hypothetical protein C8R43DRAFT_1123260 [Mycena crocata]|nr:hypothetical protein C8R43DRAFT_1123260 [Mycena crocata]